MLINNSIIQDVLSEYSFLPFEQDVLWHPSVDYQSTSELRPCYQAFIFTWSTQFDSWWNHFTYSYEYSYCGFPLNSVC